MNKRVLAIALTMLMLFFGVGHHLVKTDRIYAQYGPTVPIGFAAPSANFTTLATSTGAAGLVTNPASNFLIQVDGGPVWCFGGQDQIPEDNITLLASTTYLIVYNCQSNFVYAKTAVTAPGTPSPNQPGVPATLLFAATGEVPLATVVCNATACGNGGNGSITDARPLGAFPLAHMIPQTTFANLPSTYADGGVLLCSSCTVLTAGSATCTSGAGKALAVRVSGAWRCF